MAIINLRDYYPFYTSDCFMEVSEEVAEMFKEFERKEAAYRLRTYRHKAYYSLDRDDGLEHEAVFVALSPHELYAKAEFYKQMSNLTKQGKCILMISSDMPELISMSDRVLVVRDGRIDCELKGEQINEQEIIKRALGVNKDG